MTVKMPVDARALTDRGAAPWATAEERLENPERPRTYWLATVNGDGRPHVMPIIGMWMEGEFYFVSGEGTHKARNLAREPRCTVVTGTTTLPSLDLIVDGVASMVTDDAMLARVTEAYRTRMEWPLELRDRRLHGPERADRRAAAVCTLAGPAIVGDRPSGNDGNGAVRARGSPTTHTVGFQLTLSAGRLRTTIALPGVPRLRPG